MGPYDEPCSMQWRIQHLQTGDKNEAPQAPRSTTIGARIEAPQAFWAGRGRCPYPEKNVSILDIKMATLGAFWALLFTFQLFVLDAKSSA